uniref:Uncharacterized protein n=2 Tax=Candidatus Kentrum sp. LPFa TaxID=2126335 RepID=A0A450X3L1_9GAMM|nr:MAG: hypothetical protein BECKLPF1236C_GA0070990_1000818 [Candidatus Kentron sp. LPFa]
MSQVLAKFRRRPTKHGSVLVKHNRRFIKLKALPTTVKMTSEWLIGVLGKAEATPLPPRCREGVDSPHLPTRPFRVQVLFLAAPFKVPLSRGASVLTYTG